MRCTYFTGLFILCLAAPMAMAKEQLTAVRNGATSSGSSMIPITSAIIAIIALVALVLFVRRFLGRRAERAKSDPGQLLRELCLAHGLSRRAERLLKKAAVAVGTPDPGRFFLEPRLLRQAEKCDALKGSRRTIGLLYEQLFGDETL